MSDLLNEQEQEYEAKYQVLLRAQADGSYSDEKKTHLVIYALWQNGKVTFFTQKEMESGTRGG